MVSSQWAKIGGCDVYENALTLTRKHSTTTPEFLQQALYLYIFKCLDFLCLTARKHADAYYASLPRFHEVVVLVLHCCTAPSVICVHHAHIFFGQCLLDRRRLRQWYPSMVMSMTTSSTTKRTFMVGGRNSLFVIQLSSSAVFVSACLHYQ